MVDKDMDKRKKSMNLAGSDEGKIPKKKKRSFLSKFRFRNLKKHYVWILAALMLIVLLLSRTIGDIKRVITGPERPSEPRVQEFVDLVPVELYVAGRIDFTDTLPVMGRIKGYNEIDLHFQTAGVLESFNFREGERVLRGDIIASLNQQEALLKLQYASLELEKAKTLHDLGGLAKMAVEQKELEYESSRQDLAKTNLYAPSDGYLATAEVDPGRYLTPQNRVGQFVDFSEVWAVFDIVEEDTPKIRLGQNAEVYVDAFPGERFEGRIDTISPVIEGRTRSQRIQVELDNRREILRPGMFARAVINTYEQRNALVIPSSAFERKDNTFYVYVVHPREEELPEPEESAHDERFFAEAEIGVVERRQIEIKYMTHDVAEVSEGLEEGEMIIREIHLDFRDDDHVEIVEVQDTIF